MGSIEEVDRLHFLAPHQVGVSHTNDPFGRRCQPDYRTAESKISRYRRPPKEDICYATQNRQEAVARFAPEANLVLVVGSQNSSNSQRLAELARETGARAFLIDGPANIDLGWFADDDTVLITAGASAPKPWCRSASSC